jgi:hypothetical protein
VERRKSRRDTLGAVLRARPGPWHEIINARGRPQIDQFGQDVLDVGLRINTVELAGLDQRGDGSPVGRALVAAGTGELLSEFYGPKDSDRGLCSYRGGKFPTAECTWNEYLDKANRM